MSDAKTANTWSAAMPLAVGLLSLLVLVGGFGGWAVTSKLYGAVIASGRIEVDRNRQIIQHRDGGVVDEINVIEGKSVQKGDVLMRLNADDILSELSIIESQLYEFIARRGRLEAERDDAEKIEFDPVLINAAATYPEALELMDGQSRLFEARNITQAQEIEQLGKRRTQIESQIDGYESESVALNRQLELIETELETLRGLLDKGLAQAGRVLAMEREQAGLMGNIGELASRKAQAEGRITETDLEVLKLGSTRREEAIEQLRELQYRELELAERFRALTAQRQRLVVRAPVSGVVYGLTVFTSGAVVRPAEPVFYIIPSDRPLVIAANIEVTAIDQVHLDQEVALRFSAFDQRSTPEFYGTVRQVSADAFSDENTGLRYYRVEIALNDGEMAKLGEGQVLVPGMPVEAFIATGSQSPLDYLLKPLADYFHRAFRET